MPSTAALRMARDPAAPSTVLVVDDDELMRVHLGAILQFAGYSVQTAANAEQALQVLEGATSCLVLADWEMPGMDGLALCRAIRDRQADSYVYVLLLTVRGAPDDVVAGFNAGADDYVVKGRSVEELIARLESGRRIIAHHQLRHERRRARPAAAPFLLAKDPVVQDLRARLALDYDRCREHGAPLAALACGIDYLDCVADRFGASVAARLLASIRTEIGKLLLEMDWVAAIDDRTLFIVLTHATLESARHVAEKARKLVADGGRFCTTGIPLTASVGVAALEGPDDFRRHLPASLFSAALQSLEQSRNQGGDSVTAAPVRRPIS
jgi:two-component system, cell cycle response regulator